MVVRLQKPQMNNSPPSSAGTETSTRSESQPQIAARLTEESQAPAQHSMVTRSKSGIVKPNPKYALLTANTVLREPESVQEALAHPGWNASMHEEHDNCAVTKTWSLVPRTSEMHVLGNKWIHRIKLGADGTVKKLRSRLVAQGCGQEEGIDYWETYSPVVRTATVRLILHTATVMKWDIKQMDVANAFFHGDLTETVYMKQPTGFVDPMKPDHVCLLHRSLYGLKAEPTRLV